MNKNFSTPPLVIAHRGARKYAPENSISAFRKAVELGLDGVELDVLCTSDGIPVVCHDDDLKRLSGEHVHIHRTPYSMLKEKDIGRLFNPFYAGERIPSLKEALDVFTGTNMLINIEVKSQPHQHGHFMERVVDTIEASGLKPQITVSSFKRNLLYRLGRIAPEIRRAQLLLPRAFFFLDAVFSASMLEVHGINPHVSKLSKGIMKFARKRNLSVITWTANRPEDIRRSIDMGVDGVITDEPALVKEMIRDTYGR